jgi:phytoene desaturase (3,4-didehydrolycopene-forming)
MSPFDSPATYNLLQYTEYAQSIWYPEGGSCTFLKVKHRMLKLFSGFYTVPEAFMNIAKKKFGAKFHFNSDVRKIRADRSGKVQGVELASGEFMPADAVVSNADLVYTYNT